MVDKPRLKAGAVKPKSNEDTAVHTRYRNAAGKVVPGVTTVINILAKPALVGWAWRLGLDGQDMNKVKQQAADIGTVTHYLCECVLTGVEPKLGAYKQNDIDVAMPCYDSFKRWFTESKLVAVAVECGVVSELWQYGGTIDLIARDGGKLGLYDVKTSKGVYDEYQIQMSAYVEAWNELHPDTPIEFVKIIHLDKETGMLATHDLSMEKLKMPFFEIFKHLRAIYVLQKGTELSSYGGKKQWPRKKSK